MVKFHGQFSFLISLDFPTAFNTSFHSFLPSWNTFFTWFLEHQHFCFSACPIGWPSSFSLLDLPCFFSLSLTMKNDLGLILRTPCPVLSLCPLDQLMYFCGFKCCLFRAGHSPKFQTLKFSCLLVSSCVFNRHPKFNISDSKLLIPHYPLPQRNIFFACAPLSANDTTFYPATYAKSLGGNSWSFLFLISPHLNHFYNWLILTISTTTTFFKPLPLSPGPLQHS